MDSVNFVYKNHLNFDIDVGSILTREISQLHKKSGVNFYFILSYPRSDMGKGTVAATLCSLLPNSNLIKFDGLLNTNKDNRHLTTERDDFEIYEKYNPHLRFGKNNYILLGETLVEFIEKYGEGDHISFRPHFAHFFIERIYDNWKKLGSPNNLIVEFGGTINDSEVSPFIPYTIAYYKRMLGSQCKTILLTELGFNGEYIKTKVAQDAVQTFVSKSICPDYLLLREPRELTEINCADRKIFHQEVAKKLSDNLNVFFESERIWTVPFFKDGKIDYRQILSSLIKVDEMSKIFIGSKNKGKISDWNRYFTNIEIVTPYDNGVFVDVTENSESIFENAKNKAIAWSKSTELTTVSDDTGFFIPGLGGKPGVAVKTFGGELPETRSDKKYIQYVISKVKGLSGKNCYFESAVAFAKNGVLLIEDSYKIEGELVVDNIDLDSMKFEEGFPIGSIFRPFGARDVWINLSDGEKSKFDTAMITCVNDCLKRIF